ncbi:amidohydrolase family protein [Microterricola pindariensis]|uniref:Amidohydrolase-related domain-containing protein n=1 Tax=Microterricola pindariensis TaxID=478010 RepID=A0ABX5AXB0_9MICO|nr:amidohydrolase family protein [Microterricola pindariensis]PPL19563.1 hypothetical protein GY24_05085 [Microterricola pindariensis]
MSGRFDAHIHLFETGYHGTRESGAELADYEALRAVHGIDDALVVGYEGQPRFHGNNEYVLGLGRELGWVTPLLHLDPERPLSIAAAEAALDAGAAGFSIYLGDDGALIDAFSDELWSLLGARTALLSVNATPEGLRGASERIRALDTVRVLISHLGLPGATAGRADQNAALLALHTAESVTVKFSGLYAIDPVAPHHGARDTALAVLDSFGAARMLWGSDFAPGLDTVRAEELFAVPAWLAEQLTPAESAQILGGTLRTLCGKDTP